MTEAEKMIIGFVARYCDIPEDQVKPESRLEEDLMLDSLSILEIAIDVEEEFDVEIEEFEVKTVGDIIVKVAHCRRVLG